jgi:hypothetical protein
MTVRVGQPGGRAGFIGSGAVAGAVAALVFTAVHQLLINPIWFALPAMLVAGAICGTCLAWSYTLVVPTSTVRSWLGYNSLYLVMIVALGLTSLIAFEPVTTIAALLQTNEPPRALIGSALPVSGLFTLATAALLSAAYRPGWRGAGGLLVTTGVLVLVLGLNISILGLVGVPRGALGVLVEVLALLMTLSGVYVGVVVVLNRARFGSAGSA